MLCLVCTLMFWFLSIDVGCQTRKKTSSAKVDDQGTYLIHVPDGLSTNKKVPLVLALSPGGDAASMIRVWARVADRREWIVAASKEFSNEVEYSIVFRQLKSELNGIEKSYPIDTSKIIITGLSGGAMASHAFARFHPDRIRAVVANTGMMEETFMTDDYPRGKWAVFLGQSHGLSLQ